MVFAILNKLFNGTGSVDVKKTGDSSEKSAREIFAEIYHRNIWGSDESRSGQGSDMVQTEVIRRELPLLIKKIGVSTMLDIPCGDWHWMKMVDMDVDYIGADIVPEIVEKNQRLYSSERRQFMILDMAKDDLPKVDLIFSRDVLVHLAQKDVFSALRNMKRSGSAYLLTTTFTERNANIDIQTGQWRPLNLQKTPFDFPEPLLLINENCTEGDGSWGDKSLGLWRINDLPVKC